MPATFGRRRFAVLTATAVVASALAGCGDDVTATSTRYGPDAWRTFFSPIGTGQSEEFLRYASLREAVRDRMNVTVLVGAGRDVRVSQDLGGETDAERWLVLTARFPLTRLLTGTSSGDAIDVEFASFDAPEPGDAEAVVATLGRALTELGPAIWILQRSSTRPVHLRLATTQCLFVERRGKLTNPMYPGGTSSDPVADEGMDYRKLDRLAVAIERIAAG